MLTYDLNQKGSLTIYEYLYQCIKQDILEGRIEAHEKLPSKRTFAKHQQISLKTVENAYEQLLVEGYLYAEEKKGYFAAPIARDALKREHEARNKVPFHVYDEDEDASQYWVDFTANRATVENFPYVTWVKTIRNVLLQREQELLETVSFQGIFELREEIAKYLYGFRGMQVSPDQIIIGAGTEYLYGRLIQLLGRDHIFAVEDPGYRNIPKIFQAHQVKWESIGIDEEGLLVDELYQSEASVVHVSPGHHFPTGSIMPITRRQQLLEWAESGRERYIIEDDYDSEFRFSRMPVPAIQSLNHNHRVIYMNTFSKTLAPSIRISYMVLPRKLIERYVQTMNFYSCSVSALEQYAMAEFMNHGYFERHIHRMRGFYKKKRDAMLKALEESMNSACFTPTRFTIEEKDAGNHFLLKVETSLSDTELKWMAREQGIKLDCLSEYCFQQQPQHQHTIIVNYSDLEEEKFKRAIQIIAEYL